VRDYKIATYWDQSNHLVKSTAGVSVLLRLLRAPQQVVEKCWAKNYFAQSNLHVLTFLHPKFTGPRTILLSQTGMF
jgi:hypothetical protein